jgi:vacuolar-type H+-ATPase catalytic subunit A/Vma1
VSVKVKRRMKKNITELPPSKYLEKYFGIRLSPKVAEFWDRAGYVSDDGAIDFENVNIRIGDCKCLTA